MLNISTISPDCAFICGAPGGILNDDFSEFAKIQELLYANNRPSICENTIGFKTTDLDRQHRLKVMAAHMVLCKQVITLPGWEKSADCITLIGIARLIGMEVLFSETVLKTLKNPNDDIVK